jgi:hypothetical protein
MPFAVLYRCNGSDHCVIFGPFLKMFCLANARCSCALVPTRVIRTVLETRPCLSPSHPLPSGSWLRRVPP